jgi:hypothetical protein
MEFMMTCVTDYGEEYTWDCPIFNLKIQQREGKCAQATLLIQAKHLKNLKNQGQIKIFMNKDGENILLFLGYLPSLPLCVKGNWVTLQAWAQPHDQDRQEQELMVPLQIPPYWEPLVLSTEEQQNPQHVLRTQKKVMDICRLTHLLSLKDMMEEEDLLTWSSHMILEDSFEVTWIHRPFSRVCVSIRAPWIQYAEGEVDITPHIEDALKSPFISTLTGKDLEEKWWKPGERIGRSGYWVTQSKLHPLDSHYANHLHSHPRLSSPVPQDHPQKGLRLRRSWYKPYLKLGWRYRQKRQEIVSFHMDGPHSPWFSGIGPTARIQLHVGDLGQEQATPHWQPFTFYYKERKIYFENQLYRCDQNHHSDHHFEPSFWIKEETLEEILEKPEEIHASQTWNRPIKTWDRSSFFDTPKGIDVIGYAIDLAHTTLFHSYRCLEVKLTVPLYQGHHVNCRHTITLKDDRLPGGTITGQVFAYEFEVDGDKGTALAHITLRSVIHKEHFYGPKNSQEYKGEYETGSGIKFSLQPHQSSHETMTIMNRQNFIQHIDIIHEGKDQDDYMAKGNYVDLYQGLNDRRTDINIHLKSLQKPHVLCRTFSVTFPNS